MDQETLFEEIRTRLREAQEDTVTTPWQYTNEDLIKATRSAIRYLRVIKVTMLLDMDLSGTFDTDPTEVQGMLIALRVVSDLLRGDLSNKLNNGELGVSVKSVMDSFSTTEAARGFQKSAEAFTLEYNVLLNIVLTDDTDTALGVFGQPELSTA